jgi:formate dehydrogenase maturation protein FdhE
MTIEDFDSCETCGCSLTWINFKSTCAECENEFDEEYDEFDADYQMHELD